MLFVVLITIAAAPLGAVEWRGERAAAFLLAPGLAAALYAAHGAWPPMLAPTRALAVKAHAAQGGPDPLRLAMTERSLRQYVAARPTDPESWLLAAWIEETSGQSRDAASLARYAASLDPCLPALQEAARALVERSRE